MDGRFEKVEFRKLSALRAKSSSGNVALSLPYRDSEGGVNSATGSRPSDFIASLYSSALPDGVWKLPRAKGRNGPVAPSACFEADSVDGAKFSLTWLSLCKRLRVIPCSHGLFETSAPSIISSTLSLKHSSLNPMRVASARNRSTLDRHSPRGSIAWSDICR